VEGWVRENVETIMLGVGIMSVIGVAVIFAIYFYVSHKVKKKKQQQGS